MSDSNTIELTRGNSALIEITPMDSETQSPIILDDGDYVLFTVKDMVGNTILQKKLTSDDYPDAGSNCLNCILEPSDTVVAPLGVHKYDCLYVTGDGRAVTFISSHFILSDACGIYTDAVGGDTGE